MNTGRSVDGLRGDPIWRPQDGAGGHGGRLGLGGKRRGVGPKRGLIEERIESGAAAGRAVVGVARLGGVVAPGTRLRKDTELIGSPALKHAVRVLTRVAVLTLPLSKLRARRPGIVKLPGIPPASLLAGMRKRALSPVMRSPPRALPHLELIHTELIARERVDGNVKLVGVRNDVVHIRRKVTLQRLQGVEPRVRTDGVSAGIAAAVRASPWKRRVDISRWIVDKIPRWDLHRLMWMSRLSDHHHHFSQLLTLCSQLLAPWKRRREARI
nr:ADP,ATP carrier protein 1, chloroplastic [Ipomoea batatas]